MKMKNDIWYWTKDYINRMYSLSSKTSGIEITRQGLIFWVYQHSTMVNRIMKNGKPTYTGISEATIDVYRNMLEKMGYLNKTSKRGVYIIVKPINVTMTTSQLRSEYDKLIKLKQWG